MKGCQACADAKPEFEEFKRQTFGKLIHMVADITHVSLSLTGFEARATPTYELSDEKRKPLKRVEGALDLAGLHDFAFGDLGKKVRK